jgi:hypothetical protein
MNWRNIPDNVKDYFGFVYLITNKINGRDYIGKKQFVSIRRVKVKGKKRRKIVITESDWKDYYGSSNELMADIKKYGKEHFQRSILTCCKTRWDLTYTELKYQVDLDVLKDKRYYNGIIRVRLPAKKIY